MRCGPNWSSFKRNISPKWKTRWLSQRTRKEKSSCTRRSTLTATGAVGGGFWGARIALIFLNPLLGAAVGAGAGALSGKLADIGINDKFMKELGETFQPNTSALFVLVKEATPDKVLAKLKGFGGKVLQTSLSKEDEEKLQKALTDKTSIPASDGYSDDRRIGAAKHFFGFNFFLKEGNMSTTSIVSTPLKYLDKALNRLRDLGLMPAKPEEAPIVELIEQISDWTRKRRWPLPAP